LSVRFQIDNFPISYTPFKSTSHHGFSFFSVCETEFSLKSPFVFPSIANFAGLSWNVLLCVASPPVATFSFPLNTCTSASDKIFSFPGISIRT
jgi:hypothetical protein